MGDGSGVHHCLAAPHGAEDGSLVTKIVAIGQIEALDQPARRFQHWTGRPSHAT
jgi:hypothetical protein